MTAVQYYEDDITTDDDYVVVEVRISPHGSGFMKVKTYGPYTRGEARRVREKLAQLPPETNWIYHYSTCLMTPVREEAAA